jgi:hypothetical protein
MLSFVFNPRDVKDHIHWGVDCDLDVELSHFHTVEPDSTTA